MHEQPFDITMQPIAAVPGAIALYVRGELDMHGSPPFKEVFDRALSEDILYALVILNEVRFIDSHNIGAFVGAYQRLRPKGGWLAIICTQPYVRRVFEIMNLDRLFRFYDDWEAFSAALQADHLATGDVPYPSFPQPTSA